MAKKKGLDGRQRDVNGQTRSKNGNTLVSTLREEYGPKFGGSIRGVAKLSTLLKRKKVDSLSALLKKMGKKK